LNLPIQELIDFRKELHRYPELSNDEYGTADRVKKFITQHHPTGIIDTIGGAGLAAVYKFSDTGKTIVIRCELDALPIHEVNQVDYSSLNDNVSHKCGHDGHMAIVAGLIFWIKNQSFSSGTIVLLFQPAEEIGQGAYRVLNAPEFRDMNVDYIFALHNIPKNPMHSVIVMDKGFSAEVISFVIRMHGKESHAAEPEHGINPAECIAEVILALSKLAVVDTHSDDYAILTPVHINLGQASYGVSPADGEMHYTIRAWTDVTMTRLKTDIVDLITEYSSKYHIESTVEWLEHFPASQNNAVCNDYIRRAAAKNNYKIIEREIPFKFGEDFGWFSHDYRTAMFGLGSGDTTPALHNPDYDFPDEIIETGIHIFADIIADVLNS
jgi:amidohydrolase